ncbi:head GIN domain-containing protein [Gelidibacter sp.]|uniref:head GIN domain-containing protein n=1 Tax=Gelidibacter sp. TaxID=2018083 RepID=UPI002CC3DE10|nr:head GIN domain-containing protein [Gelidibacter sp.]HUH28457.1 head GIN domain-containing protein [Gelidibacter sp.]
MKKSILFVAVLLLTTTSQAQMKIKGNGNITSITRTTSAYDAVTFAGPFDYVLVSGTEGKIKIEGEENLLQYIITEVKNGTLNVKIENKVNLHTSKNKTIKITVPFEDINTVFLTGSGDVWNENTISTPHFKTSVTGSGDIILDVEATSVDANVTGSGDLTLKGKTNHLKASVTGSGDFKGLNLIANDVNVSVNGSGDAKVVCNGQLTARVSGSGDIKYSGNPKSEDTKVAGSGSISN